MKRLFKKEEKVAISNYLDESLIAFLDASERNTVLSQLVKLLDDQDKLIDGKSFYEALLEREKIVSTGIGIGVAIPHAKLPDYKEFFIAIGILKNRGVDWDALDGLPVRIVFMIGGPNNQQTQYLKILSLLTMAIKDEKRRKLLLKASKPSEVIEIFQGL